MGKEASVRNLKHPAAKEEEKKQMEVPWKNVVLEDAPTLPTQEEAALITMQMGRTKLAVLMDALYWRRGEEFV